MIKDIWSLNFVIIGCYDGGVYILVRDIGDIIWMYRIKLFVKSFFVVDFIIGWIYIGFYDYYVYLFDIEVY